MQPGGRHADRPADDAFLGQAGVEDPAGSEFLLQPESRRVYAALAADILAEDQHSRVDRKLMLERAAHGGHQIDARALRARLRRARRRHGSRRTDSALLLQVDGAVGCRLRK